MTWAHWWSLALVCVLGAVSPGPSLAMVVRHTMRGGALQGVAAALSHALGVGIYAVMTVAGIGFIMTRFPLIYQFISIVGAIYLLWLGVNALRSRPAADGATVSDVAEQDIASAVRDGFGMALANPKLILFFVALLSQFIEPGSSLAASALVVMTVMIIDGLWYILVAKALARPAPLALLRRKGWLVERASGAVFILLALVVLGEVAHAWH
ncbi:LysE family translocator [Larsenimonas suaedae]|uniref:LysE family translocator n=1 Tax=Larsenimonas suaedae TaxID=1851019 RepID=A0ABU1GU76_9GAMM|nr:LysE family translocator [Larsenimonas suaedae]MCM2972064.1 LysE family translocator [Larsenimonas suaedae]MDR5895142.1 LysE family translocator [Larsenimonas suaedae]